MTINELITELRFYKHDAVLRTMDDEAKSRNCYICLIGVPEGDPPAQANSRTVYISVEELE